VRYVAALGCLTFLAILPLAIATWIAANSSTAIGSASAVPAQPVIAAESSVPQPLAATTTPPIRATTGSSADPTALGATGSAIAPAEPPNPVADSLDLSKLATSLFHSSVHYLPWLWIIGTPLTFLLLATGVVGSERLRRASRILHDGPIADACTRLVEALHIGRSVTVAVCERIASPVLVGIVRPIVLLPPAALTGWSPDEIEMVLLHELAHVRRWDNLVNLVQRLVEAVLFFHPAVWVVGRTNRPQAYAEMLLNLAAHIGEPSEPGRPRPRANDFTRGRGRPGSLVSSAMAAGPLRGRIRRILNLEDDPMLISGKSLGIVMSSLLLAATLLVLNLPARTQAGESVAEGAEHAETKSDRSASRHSIGFTVFHRVPLEVGASQFADGDSITITAIKGTSKMFEPGNVYQIHGTYTLASRDRATLGANVTARNAAEGRSSEEENQSMTIERGSGTFMLEIPMKIRGWPHLSFYPAEGGQSFGGVYFGTGDSVLKEWSEVYGADDTRSAESRVKVDRGKFPSLEDQKLADLIWRRVSMELEPLSVEDLKRVEALGYQGGVIVKYGHIDHRPDEHGQIVFGDVLVGLHVWPTKSLKDVAEVLYRDDLADLNPLKFYVVHQKQQYPDGGVGDEVVTGRISVNVDERPRTRSPATDRYSAPKPTGKPQPSPSAATYGDQFVPAVAEEAANTAKPSAANTDLFSAPSTTTDQPTLRYDGKTFDEWRNVWLTMKPVGTDRRLEAIKVLEAFGNAGYGQQAADAILYGTNSGAEIIEQRSRKYLSTLSPEVAQSIVTNLIDVLSTDLSAKRRIAAIRALAAIGPNAKPALDVLNKTLVSDDLRERIASAAAIKMIVGKDRYQKPVADVLGEELGITVVESDGVWGALPRKDVKDGGKAFSEFTEAVIKEQQQLFPDGEF
jgi:beta-lactamase regulating signal transducer with metallopeptidase domain